LEEIGEENWVEYQSILYDYIKRPNSWRQ